MDSIEQPAAHTDPAEEADLFFGPFEDESPAAQDQRNDDLMHQQNADAHVCHIPSRWLVTLEDKGIEICLEVGGNSTYEARVEALRWHPTARIVHIEATR